MGWGEVGWGGVGKRGGLTLPGDTVAKALQDGEEERDDKGADDEGEEVTGEG